MYISCACSTLSDLSREMEANVPVLTRQKKEGEFMRQKAEQYQKLVTSMKVRYINSWRSL